MATVLFKHSRPIALNIRRSTLERLLTQFQSARSASSDSGSGPAGGYHYTDYRAPNFEGYLRDSLKDPYSSSLESDAKRKTLTYGMYAVALGAGIFYAKAAVRGIAMVRYPPVSAFAVAGTEIKLSLVPEGETKTFVWRGNPIFVKHRTQEEIDREMNVDHSALRHPQKDEERVKKPEWLVLIGVCTHLGCVPIANSGAYHGWYCPCHGSHYDGSGRIRKGPAPLNLEIPPYKFMDEETLMIGDSGEE